MSSTPAQAKIVECPSCGASITLRALGQSVMTVCASCGTQIDVSRPELRIIKQYRQQQQRLHIPLGTRGTLRGQLFEVIGAMQRADGAGCWDEYLLFNPYIGFRWLTHDTGHWSLGRTIRDVSNVTTTPAAHYRGHYFRRYTHGTAEVRWVVGEFYWRVKVGNEAETRDYVEPPLMLSCEKAPGEITWTLLEYLEPAEVEAAFHITSPQREWLAANQPNPASQKLRAIKPILLVALLAVVLVQIGTAIRAHNTRLPVGLYDMGQAKGESQAYGPFTFSTPGSMNEFLARAPLHNSWVELQCSLVNTVTGQSFDFTDSFSYYSGRDSDGSWSEGSDSGSTTLTGIPAGTYQLVVAAGGADQSGLPLNVPVSLALRHDVTPWQNFWLALLLILIYPGYLLYRRYASERERWSEADPL
jgi:Domain of unknown function (DUF4178)